MDMLQCQTALNKAKIQLMSREDSAFFTTICFSLKHIWDDTIKTAATNGAYIKFNPEFFMSLSPEERIFLLIHESMHVAFLHMERLQEHNPDKWNIAADHVINLLLIERGFRMPKIGYADHAFKGMSTEQVYPLIPDNQQCNQPDLVEGEGTPEELQQHVQDILVRAAIQSKMQNDKPGTIPGEIELFLNKLLKPKLPWNRILQKYLFALAKDDYSFRKPNRRFFPDYYLPSLYSEKLVDIAIAVDISGSVSEAEFLRFISEIHSILKMMKPDKLSLIQFDTSIKSVDEIRNVHELSKVRFLGRGGTDIRPVIDWVNKRKPQLLLTFTDGGFYFRDAQTKVNTAWLIHNNPCFTAPFGKVIHYEMGEN